LLAELGLIADVDLAPEPEPVVTLVVVPSACSACRGRGWQYVTDDDSWPTKQPCGRCTGAFDRWDHALIEEPAGDVDDHGIYVGDAA
jgi:hypothetical protein